MHMGGKLLCHLFAGGQRQFPTWRRRSAQGTVLKGLATVIPVTTLGDSLILGMLAFARPPKHTPGPSWSGGVADGLFAKS